jgi:hypothetical protein
MVKKIIRKESKNNMRNIPICRNHYSRPGVRQCCICSDWFCKYCKTVEINGKIYCEACAPGNVRSYRFNDIVCYSRPNI